MNGKFFAWGVEGKVIIHIEQGEHVQQFALSADEAFEIAELLAVACAQAVGEVEGVRELTAEERARGN